MAYSGNINDLNDAIERWNRAGLRVHIDRWYDVGLCSWRIRASVCFESSGLTLVEKHFTDESLYDYDTSLIKVTTWLNKNFEDYRSWK